MPTINQLLMDAIKYDMDFYAYLIITCVQEKLVSSTDHENKLHALVIPDNVADKIYTAHEADVLKIRERMVKLYLIKNGTDFAMYLARNVAEAQQLHQTLFRQAAVTVIDATDKKNTQLYFPETKRTKSFYEIEQSAVKLPYFVGVMASKKAQSKERGEQYAQYATTG